MVHPIDRHVGKRIRGRRLLVGMTQQQLAEKSGVSFQQIQKYEMGTNRVSASRLFELAELLQCSVPSFFDGLSDSKAEPQRDLLGETEAMKLVNMYYRIPENLRVRLLELAKALAE
ncbi:helix-turn-helix domain-containing protein [Aliiroseovarius sp. 2305UL8-7]|uniref:helix-turn-helix domain-containing protein n=1 Tax=Aliiroseovarius conchicola TaxID=3121637 RepID=UPI00352929FF